MSTAPVRGRFVWHELMTTDTKSAAAFFTKVVGWKTRTWDQEPSYTMFVANGAPMAGVLSHAADAKTIGAPTTWLTYIGTPDVEETARQAMELGGKILKQPADIPTIGRFAIIQDPQGAAFAAFTPIQPPRGDRMGEVEIGDFSWHELPTTDRTAAFEFYQRLFGWEPTESMDMGSEGGVYRGIYQMFGWKGKSLGGMFTKAADMPGPPAWIAYVKVVDTKKAARTVKKLGGTIVTGPMQVPDGDWVALGLDPQGALFAIHSKLVATKTTAAKLPAKTRTTRKRAAKKAVRKARPAKRTAAAKRSKARR